MSKLKNLRMNWDLESVFSGGSESRELTEFMEQLKADLEKLKDRVASSSPDEKELLKLVVDIQNTADEVREASAFVNCLVSQDATDKKAKVKQGQIRELGAVFDSIMINLEAILTQFSDEKWNRIMEDPDYASINFFLSERRKQAREKLSPDKEKLASDLAVDGYHGWGELYHTIIGDINIEHNGKNLSVGQAQNLLSDSKQETRTEIGHKLEEAYGNKEHLISSALNHLAGYRLSLYKNRGWDNVIKEPLMVNRTTNKTLEIMWETISKHKKGYLDYFKRKKELLGLEEFGWFDRTAPISKTNTKVSYDEAANFIVNHFRNVSKDLADFSQMALANRWVEAEDRENKRPGGFCTTFPMTGESRIFMTYSGTPKNVATLAHELGHAYHQWILKDQPSFASRYPMTLAETASTFAEQVISDAAIEASESKEERLTLLEDKISRSSMFFMDIHTRYLFELNFYEERARGPVPADRLNEMMLASQKEAYLNGLDEWHPRFWAAKLHFYITRVPFYNFPYTFGYLFSLGVYALYKKSPENFPEIYKDLLRDTGRMTAEELAAKHLEVDLTKPDFWEEAVGYCLADLNKFLELTKEDTNS